MNASQAPLNVPSKMSMPRPSAMKRKPNPRPSTDATRVAQADPPRVPQSRVEHATAVEGQRRSRLNASKDEVRVTEPGRRPVERVGEPSGRQPDEEHTEHERNEGSRDRNPELGAGPRKRALELGDSTEEPEVDAFDLDALSLGLQSVAELVQQERGEEEEEPPRRPTRCTRRPRSRDSGRGRPQMRETRR